MQPAKKAVADYAHLRAKWRREKGHGWLISGTVADTTRTFDVPEHGLTTLRRCSQKGRTPQAEFDPVMRLISLHRSVPRWPRLRQSNGKPLRWHLFHSLRHRQIRAQL
jgi:hypothetical protein